jgi:hypothetical protein
VAIAGAGMVAMAGAPSRPAEATEMRTARITCGQRQQRVRIVACAQAEHLYAVPGRLTVCPAAYYNMLTRKLVITSKI